MTKLQLKKLLSNLLDYIDKKEDSLRFYHICQNCKNKSFEICNRIDIFENIDFFV